jgi:hypothetical protein
MAPVPPVLEFYYIPCGEVPPIIGGSKLLFSFLTFFLNFYINEPFLSLIKVRPPFC